MAVVPTIVLGVYLIVLWVISSSEGGEGTKKDEGETKTTLEQIESMGRQMESDIYDISSRATESALAVTEQKDQDRVILFHADTILSRKGGEEEFLNLAQGAIKGIEKQESRNPDSKVYIALTGKMEKRKRMEELLNHPLIPQKYLLKNFLARTPYEAVKKSEERNLAIAYVLTTDPEAWSEYYLNLITLGEGEMKIRGSFAFTLWQSLVDTELYDPSRIEWDGEELTFKRVTQPIHKIEERKQESDTVQSNA
ncbi:MAG: hypothetical protein HYY07_00530 [Elusimicrobia bacterium]|nr:hypothetical protein [Elusimicrobiota bacterium]